MNEEKEAVGIDRERERERKAMDGRTQGCRRKKGKDK